MGVLASSSSGSKTFAAFVLGHHEHAAVVALFAANLNHLFVEVGVDVERFEVFFLCDAFGVEFAVARNHPLDVIIIYFLSEVNLNSLRLNVVEQN